MATPKSKPNPPRGTHIPVTAFNRPKGLEYVIADGKGGYTSPLTGEKCKRNGTTLPPIRYDLPKKSLAARQKRAALDKARFLKEFSKVQVHKGIIGRAAAACDIPRSRVWKWQQDDPAFAAKVEEILEGFKDWVEDVVIDEGIIERNPMIMKELMKIHLRHRGYDKAEKLELSGNVTVLSITDIREAAKRGTKDG